MTTDTKDRRLQWGEREPRKRVFVFKDDPDLDPDIRAFELMASHGDLTAPAIHEGIKHLRSDKSQTINRLTDFYHGSLSQGALLDRHPGQFNQPFAHARHVASRLNPRAEALLSQLGRLPAVTYTRTNSVPHTLFQANAGASFELLVPEGIDYLSRSYLITVEREGEARSSSHPLRIPVPENLVTDPRLKRRKGLTPDDVFGLRIDGKLRPVFLEIDRDTESWDGGQSEATYFFDKLRLYEVLYLSDVIYEWFGFRRPVLAIITTNTRRAEQIMREADKLNPKLRDRLYLTIEPSMDTNWRSPKDLYRQVYGNWQTVNGPARIHEA